MRSNKVENSTVSGLYYKRNDVKVHFCMTQFSGSNIIEYPFHFDNGKGELGIGYDMIICRDVIVKLGLTADFKRQVLQWDGAIVPMKEPRSLIGKSYLSQRKCVRWLCRQHNQLPRQKLLRDCLKFSTITMQRQTLNILTITQLIRTLKKEINCLGSLNILMTCLVVL